MYSFRRRLPFVVKKVNVSVLCFIIYAKSLADRSMAAVARRACQKPNQSPKTKSQKPKAKTVDRKPNSMRGGGRERCRTGASRKRAATATHLIGLWAKSCHSTTIPMTHPHDRRTADSGPSLLGLQLIAIELVKELSNFSRLTHREGEREREGKGGRMKNGKQSKATARHRSPFTRLRLRLRLRLLYHFRLASGWRLRTAFKSGRA